MSDWEGVTPLPFLFEDQMKKPQYMRNTKTGKVCVYSKTIIEEMPWYEAITDEPQPEQTQPEPEQESVAAEKTKRKSWKDALAAKAVELDAPVTEESKAAEGQPAEEA